MKYEAVHVFPTMLKIFVYIPTYYRKLVTLLIALLRTHVDKRVTLVWTQLKKQKSIIIL